jgi:rRNA processing protein Krr1/Pno1
MSKEIREHIDKFNKFRLSENLNISDVMKRIYLLVEEHNQLKIELDKSEEEMEELIDNGWDYIKLIGRKNEIEKAFDVIGLKYVS